MWKCRTWLFTLAGMLVLFAVVIFTTQHGPWAFSAEANGLGITHGAHLRPTLNYGDEILDFNSLLGKNIGLLMYFTSWKGVTSNGSAFDSFLVDRIQAQISDPDTRPVIMLSWQPLYGKDATGCNKDYSGVIPPADIINGACDTYITHFAQELKARPERYLIRFAHEMNITDSPWWPGHFSGDASLYVEMYQHVYDVFAVQEASNVEWVWSPNYGSNPPDAWNDIHNYYPGDGYVDWIGLSGYNWYVSPGHSEPWRTFEYLYDNVLTDLACQYAKPQIIAEIGSVEGGGSVPTKADWIQDAYDKAANYPFLRSIVWFNDYANASTSGSDFRVTTGTAQSGSVSQLPASTGAWTNAYASGIADLVYTSNFPTLAQATPGSVYCGAIQVYLPYIRK